MHLLHVFFTYSHHVANLNIFCFTNFLHLPFTADADAVDIVAVVALVVVIVVVVVCMFLCRMNQPFQLAVTFSHCLSIHLVKCTHTVFILSLYILFPTLIFRSPVLTNSVEQLTHYVWLHYEKFSNCDLRVPNTDHDDDDDASTAVTASMF